jgi:hypothetical protein
MTNQHPITVPIGSITFWKISYQATSQEDISETEYIATQAAQWGADQELEACCEWVKKVAIVQIADNLRTARRPKPLSLKEQALESVKRFEESGEFFWDQMRELAFIRKALEQLND